MGALPIQAQSYTVTYSDIHWGRTAETYHTIMKNLIEAGKATGPKYAHRIVLKGTGARFQTLHYEKGGELHRFNLICGATKDGTPKHWAVCYFRLSDKRIAKLKGAKTHRIEAYLI